MGTVLDVWIASDIAVASLQGVRSIPTGKCYSMLSPFYWEDYQTAAITAVNDDLRFRAIRK